MAEFKIVFKGIGLFYSKNRIWKVIFPFDNCHEVKFSSDCRERPKGALKGAGRQVAITANNPTSQFENGNVFNSFINMTANYSHRAIKKKRDWNNEAVLVSIENASFSLKELTRSRFGLKRNNQWTLPPNHIGFSAVAVIRADSITISANGAADFPVTFDTDCEITFDNDCERGTSPSENSDIAMIYRIIEDADDPTVKFTVERHDDDKAPSGGKSLDKLKVTFNNPFPQEEGLPCHLVGGSDPGDLP